MRRIPLAGWLLLVVALVALPFILPSDYYLGIATHALVLAILALSLDILIGQGGMTSLGHAVYLGVPAYAAAWTMHNAGWSPLPSVIFAVGLGTAISALFGLLALRARGLGFLMITLALGQVMWGAAYRWVDLTGGDNGIRISARPSMLGIDIGSTRSFYLVVALALVAALVCIWHLDRSPFGACLRGTRDQPRRMRMLGHDVWRIRFVAFVFAGFWGSIAGVLYVFDYLFVSPAALSLPQSAEALLMVVLGGAGTLAGPVVGAVIITLIKTVVSSYVDRWYSLLGLTFIVVVTLMPRGLVPGMRDLLRRRRP
jgi:branched-chain amino acid transport system permease protein